MVRCFSDKDSIQNLANSWKSNWLQVHICNVFHFSHSIQLQYISFFTQYANDLFTDAISSAGSSVNFEYWSSFYFKIIFYLNWNSDMFKTSFQTYVIYITSSLHFFFLRIEEERVYSTNNEKANYLGLSLPSKKRG